MRRSAPRGDTVTFAIRGPGDTFGEIAMLGSERRRSSTVAALEPAVTLAPGFSELDRLRSAHPNLERHLVELLDRQVRRLSDHLLEALHVPADDRIVRRLLDVCTRYDAPDAAGSVIVPLTQDAVGVLAAAARPTTNRVLRRLEADGIPALRRGSIEVLDREALTQAQRADAAQPLTAPEVKPRTKNRWSEKNTSIGTIIEMKAAAVSSSLP